MKTETKHTPGPWNYEGDAIVSQDGDVARIHYQSCRDPFVHLANARLISAAPELLEALECVYEAMIHCPEFARYTRANGDTFSPEAKARIAIAKAKGEA